MIDTTFSAPDLHEDFIGLSYPSYGTAGPGAQIACAHVSPTIKVEKINITILALDLGTKTGYAIRKRGGAIVHGTEVFTPRKSWSEGQKWQRYRSWLASTISAHQIDQVAYEKVIRHEVKGRSLWDAAHAYGAFEALTHMVCDGFNIQAVGVNLSTVKKTWTGSGRAKKDDMIATAKEKGFRPETDNDADALAILDWAIKQEVTR